MSAQSLKLISTLGPFLFPAVPSDPLPGTFRVVFVPGSAFRPRPGHVLGCFCSRLCLLTHSRAHLGPFLFPAVPSDSFPATFWAVFVPGALRWSVKQPFLRTTPHFNGDSKCQCPKRNRKPLTTKGFRFLLSIRYGQS